MEVLTMMWFHLTENNQPFQAAILGAFIGSLSRVHSTVSGQAGRLYDCENGTWMNCASFLHLRSAFHSPLACKCEVSRRCECDCAPSKHFAV